MPTMAYGDGTLSQRRTGAHAGRWEYRLTVDGRRRTATWDHRPTRAEKQAALEKWSKPSPAPASGDTLGEYLERWLRDGTTHLRSRTVRGYRTLVDGSIQPALGTHDLHGLSTPEVQRAVNEGLLTHHALAVLRAALSEAVRWGLIDSNPARAVRLPKRERKVPLILSPEQTRTLLAKVKGDPLEALWVLAVYTGMRQGELLGLRWQDVDLAKSGLRINRSLWWRTVSKGIREPVLTEPKTAQSRRHVPLAPVVVEKLTEHRKTQLAGRPNRDNLVFTTPQGHALQGTFVYEELHRHLKAAGLPVIRFHDLRHSTASMLISSGMDVMLVSQLLGHSNITTTLNVYAHVTEEGRRKTADKLAEILGVVSETG